MIIQQTDRHTAGTTQSPFLGHTIQHFSYMHVFRPCFIVFKLKVFFTAFHCFLLYWKSDSYCNKSQQLLQAAEFQCKTLTNKYFQEFPCKKTTILYHTAQALMSFKFTFFSRTFSTHSFVCLQYLFVAE